MDNNKQVLEKWSFPLQELYRLALTFYKQNSGKALHLSYEDNLKLIAFKQQASLGPFDPKHAPELGVLDVIGRDRHLHWQMLGDISREQAIEGFVDLLDTMCSAFRPYVEAVRQNRDETLKNDIRRMEQEQLEREKRDKEQQEVLEEGYKEEMQRRQMQDELNKQTYQQFKSYAEKQFPGNPEHQAVLIHQLQQEHYHQYMQQLQMQNQNNTSESTQKAQPNTNNNREIHENGDDALIKAKLESNTTNVDEQLQDELPHDIEGVKECGGGDEYVIIEPAKIWTRPDIEDFKAEVSAGDGDGVIVIGHGDTVTVRVPTNPNGKCIFWEFATDKYDVGFGIYFEWSKPISNEVTVHVTESDEDDEFNDDDYLSTADDLEGALSNDHNSYNDNDGLKPPISIIVPIYRRECYTNVYVGSHTYPGEGVYLLKFDNTYSVWRSKTLYYRVYYER